MDAQPPGAAPSPVTGLHIIDGATGPVLYVVTGKHTSVIDLNTNQLVRSGHLLQRNARAALICMMDVLASCTAPCLWLPQLSGAAEKLAHTG